MNQLESYIAEWKQRNPGRPLTLINRRGKKLFCIPIKPVEQEKKKKKK